MISSMQKPWPVVIEQLAELDRGQNFAALGKALHQLPSNLPEEHRPAITHWRGKTALLEDNFDVAVPQLAIATLLDPQRSANHYLLGAALVRQQQWLDARTALIQALKLQPAFEAAHLELATVHLALGEPQQALALLTSIPDAASGPLRARRAQAAVQVSPTPLAATQPEPPCRHIFGVVAIGGGSGGLACGRGGSRAC